MVRLISLTAILLLPFRRNHHRRPVPGHDPRNRLQVLIPVGNSHHRAGIGGETAGSSNFGCDRRLEWFSDWRGDFVPYGHYRDPLLPEVAQQGRHVAVCYLSDCSGGCDLRSSDVGLLTISRPLEAHTPEPATWRPHQNSPAPEYGARCPPNSSRYPRQTWDGAPAAPG